MLISCPYCQTRYQVAAEAIGSAGRKVQCANCRRAWQATPVPEAGANDEDLLDAAFDALADEDARGRVVPMPEAAGEAGGSPPPLPDLVARAAAAVAAIPAAAAPAQPAPAAPKPSRRLSVALPSAKVRRNARIAAALLFFGLIGGAVAGREQIVRIAPEMAGLYEALGMGVNVVGLEISALRSIASAREGHEVLEVRAEIANVAGRQVQVPPIIVSVRDAEGRVLYEWSVAPPATNLGAAERVGFEARLSQPPPDAVSVRLSFASGKPPSAAGSPASPSVPAAAPKDAH